MMNLRVGKERSIMFLGARLTCSTFLGLFAIGCIEAPDSTGDKVFEGPAPIMMDNQVHDQNVAPRMDVAFMGQPDMAPTADIAPAVDMAPSCAVANGGCHVNAVCTAVVDQLQCTCANGYMGDGFQCVDIDECAIDNGGCGRANFITCINQEGAAPRCEDIDECQQNNGDCGDPAFWRCANRPAGRPVCTDIEECATDNGDCGPATRVECLEQEGASPECRTYTLTDLWSGRAQFEVDLAQVQIAWPGFHFLSGIWHDNVLYAYSITNYSVQGIGRSAIGLGLSDDGIEFDGRGIVLDVGGAWQWLFPAAESPHHNVGRADGDGWAVGVNDGPADYMTFGPYAVLPEGPMTVTFELMVDVVDALNHHVVTLDVFDVTTQEILAIRPINRHQFTTPFQYQFFNLEYQQQTGHEVEFRVFWHANSYIRLKNRSVSQGLAPFVDQRIASFPGVWKQGESWYMVYECAGLDGRYPGDVCLSTSTDGIQWVKSASNPILTHQAGGWEQANIGTPSLWHENGTWYLFYHGFDGTRVQMGLATGASLTALRRHEDNPLIRVEPGQWDAGTVGKRSIRKVGRWYYMAYEGSTEPAFNQNSADPDCQADLRRGNPSCTDFGGANWSTGLARSRNLTEWQKFHQNPVLPATDASFGYDGAEFVATPDDALHLYYRSPGPGNKTKRATLTAIEPN